MRTETHIDRLGLVDSAGAWLGYHAAEAFSTARFDGWENQLTGFGTNRDKTTYSQFLYSTLLSDNTIEGLYHGDDLAARMIDIVPEEMLRKGYSLCIGDKQDEDTEAAILEALDALNVNEKMIEGMIWGDLFGGSAIVVGADDGRPAALPLVPERVRKVDALEVLDRRYLSVNSFYQAGPNVGQPETYAIGNPSAVARPVYIVHETRLIIFGGARTSRLVRQQRGYWDQSRLQRPFEVLRSFATGFKAVETLLTDGPQGVYKIKNLASLLGSNKKAALEERLNLVEMMRSAMRAMVIDSDNESFERQAFSFSGVPDVLEKLMLRLAAAAHIPVALLMGQAPAGMNATGDSDFRWFYDRVATRQTNYLAPRLRRLIEILCASKEGPTKGQPLEKLKIEFAPLWTLDPKAEAERRLAVASADKIYFDMGALTPEEIALSRFGERGWQDGYQIDRELRSTLLERDQEEALSETDPVPNKDALTPSSNEAVITVDEARAMLGLPPDADPEIGALKVTEFRAKQEAASVPGSHATDPAQNKPNGFAPSDPADLALGNPNDPHADPNQAGAPGPAGTAPKAPTSDKGAKASGLNAPAGGGRTGLPAKPTKPK